MGQDDYLAMVRGYADAFDAHTPIDVAICSGLTMLITDRVSGMSGMVRKAEWIVAAENLLRRKRLRFAAVQFVSKGLNELSRRHGSAQRRALSSPLRAETMLALRFCCRMQSFSSIVSDRIVWRGLANE